MRRIAGTMSVGAVVVAGVIALGACGGGSSGTANAPSTSELSTTTTSIDALSADTAAIKATVREINAAWKTGNGPGFEAYAAAAWPQGEWEPADLTCRQQEALDASHDEVVATLDRARATHEILVDAVEPDPNWSVPPGDWPGAGRAPDGRMYVVRMTVRSFSGENSVLEGHWAITEDGVAVWFPVPC